MKVGIITFHRAHNCGAALQCVALKMVIERMGHEAQVIDCNDIGDGLREKSIWSLKTPLGIAHRIYDFWRRAHEPARWGYRRFQQKFMAMTAPCFGGPIPTCFDRYVVGSDQIFNPEHTGEYNEVFLLKDLADDSKKLTYAASFGVESLPHEWRPFYASCLKRFAHVSVRETSGRTICKNELALDKEVSVNIDPTLLLDARDYLPYEHKVMVSGGYVFVYWLGQSTDYVCNLAERIARANGWQVIVASLITPKARKGWIFTSPDQFLYLIRNANCVVTTSFHGTSFAIINHKPFISVLPNGMKVVGRLTNLLASLSLRRQAVDEGAVLTDDEIAKRMAIDYELVERERSALRAKAMSYLRGALS